MNFFVNGRDTTVLDFFDNLVVIVHLNEKITEDSGDPV